MTRATLMLSFALLLTMLPGGCAAQSSAIRSLCEVAADGQASDGKSFSIRGLYASTFHGALVTDGGCRSVRANATLTPGYKVSRSTLKALNEITRQGKEAAVTFHAVFRVAHKEQCFGQNCEPFQVEIDQIISAVAVDHPSAGLIHEATGHAQGIP